MQKHIPTKKIESNIHNNWNHKIDQGVNGARWQANICHSHAMAFKKAFVKVNLNLLLKKLKY